jgi:hypothetical protein
MAASAAESTDGETARSIKPVMHSMARTLPVAVKVTGMTRDYNRGGGLCLFFCIWNQYSLAGRNADRRGSTAAAMCIGPDPLTTYTVHDPGRGKLRDKSGKPEGRHPSTSGLP